MTPVFIGEQTLLTETCHGDFIYLDAIDTGVTPNILRSGRWEPAIEALFLERLRPGMHVIDVGANCGYFTLAACRHVGSRGRVLAVEANPDMARRVTRSLFANGYQDRARVMNAAASDKEGKLEFTVPAEGSGFGTLLGGTRAGERMDVVAYTLDVMADTGPVDVLKIDVEGAESLVWEGAQEIIARSHELTVFMEFMPEMLSQTVEPGAFLDRIHGQGFTIREIMPDGTVLAGDRDRLLARSWAELLLTRREPG